MVKRLILTLLLAVIIMPAGVLADDATAPTPVASPETTPSPSPAPATGLGPDASQPGAGSSNAATGSLQPAGLDPLQSTPRDATGLTAPNSDALQAPASGDQVLKVLAGEADGSPQHIADQPADNWGWLWLSLLTGLVAAAGALAWRYRRRLQQRLSLLLQARAKRH